MHQQQEQDIWKKIQKWRMQLPQPGELTEGACITLLRDIEQERKMHPGPEVDQAEAVVLTALSSLRMKKKGSLSLVQEWLDRAVMLDPSYRPASELRLSLALTQLRSQSLSDRYPTIRETDNVVTRRRTVELLSSQATEELAEAGKWQQLARDASQIAHALADEEAQAVADALARLYMRREQLLVELLERVKAYASSLAGVFFSVELLTELQETIRALAEQRTEKERILPEIEPSAKEEEQEPSFSALQQLESLIGLGEVKQRIRQLAQFLQYRRLREEKGWQMQDELPLHLVLMGNPGTGKTTLARLIARLYHELGLLEKGQLIEVDRSDLVGAYVGQTEQRVMEAVQKAAGGVLFIDEAYSLKRPDSSGSDYGQAAIDTLVAAMTSGEYAGRFVVMLAGYPEEMRNFLYANPGLTSRFPETGHFVLPDFTADELLLIAEQVASRNDFSLTAESKVELWQRIEKAQVDETFGNARAVTNLVLDAIFTKGRATAGKELQWDDFTILYPEDVRGQEERSTESSAQKELDSLIGLTQVKSELAKITAFAAVQRERSSLGLPASPVELHAVFTGNPGTGKTTVAQLYARILREIGYLKRGHLVVASRADLVAGYVGQTAALTRRKIREALGGVLFIDEAYSLFGTSEQDFGQEAIHTLVEEMTRHEENLVVVLAGYPFEMNQLLASNPGLLSRFKKYVPFPDYTVEELVLIMKQAADAAGYRIASDTLAKCKACLEKAAEHHALDGNGRFSRNILQEAMQNQALRLASLPRESWSRELLAELVWEDFRSLLEVPESK